MFKRIAFKVISLCATIALVVCVLFAINGGGEIAFFGLDFTGVPRYWFILGAFVFGAVSIVAEFYGKLAGNK